MACPGLLAPALVTLQRHACQKHPEGLRLAAQVIVSRQLPGLRSGPLKGCPLSDRNGDIAVVRTGDCVVPSWRPQQLQAFQRTQVSWPRS